MWADFVFHENQKEKHWSNSTFSAGKPVKQNEQRHSEALVQCSAYNSLLSGAYCQLSVHMTYPIYNFSMALWKNRKQRNSHVCIFVYTVSDWTGRRLTFPSRCSELSWAFRCQSNSDSAPRGLWVNPQWRRHLLEKDMSKKEVNE